MNPPVFVIGGPTASGKTRLALEVAATLPSEILNADSRQVYMDMPIGTCQPSKEETASIPHHLFHFLSPTVAFSASEYEKQAIPIVDQVIARKHLAVVVGGTGFYLKALIKGTWPVPRKNPDLRRRFQRIAGKHGNAFLHRMLRRFDPESADKIAPNDSYRVIRALEIYFLSGKKRSEFAQQRPDRFASVRVYVNPDRNVLVDAIQERTRILFDRGWVGEVEILLQKYPDFEQTPAAQSLGYREIIRMIRGEMDVKECMNLVQLRTAQYAKRQLTWFRNQDGFIPVDSSHGFSKMRETVIQLIHETEHRLLNGEQNEVSGRS